MKVAYEVIGHLTVTFPNNSAVAGQVCKLSTQGKCEKCSDGDIFCGVVEEVTPAGAAVQLQGFVKLSYTGAIPYAGYTKLSSNGAGGVKIYDVEPKTAAMLMAVVADKLGKPLNELRFISIKEVE